MEIPPQAFAPVVIDVEPVRCVVCQRMLAEQLTAPWRIKCSRCGALNFVTADGRRDAMAPTKGQYRNQEGDGNG